jgi:hypothetical protein
MRSRLEDLDGIDQMNEDVGGDSADTSSDVEGACAVGDWGWVEGSDGGRDLGETGDEGEQKGSGGEGVYAGNVAEAAEDAID